MKKVFSILTLILFCGLANSQDLTFDSVRVTSPYWGAEVQTFTADGWSNCGSTNTNFVLGQPSKWLGFPINIVNLGTRPAFLGLPGVTPGVNYNWNQPGCWTQQIHNTNAPVVIDSFITAYLLDECKNVITFNSKTAWYVQNNYTYAVDKSFGQWVYYTNVFGQQPTTGNDPNPTKDWLEANCGPLDTNITLDGSQQLFAWDSNCQQCDSLILFPSFGSHEYKFTEGAVLQLPMNFPAGNYYLVLDGNFSRFETEDCQPNRIEFPFVYNGSDGEVTFISQDHTCTQASVPATPTNIVAVGSDAGRGNSSTTVSVTVSWDAVDNATAYAVTPYLLLNGNTEKALTSLSQVCAAPTTQKVFAGSTLKMADEVQALLAGSNNDRKNLKFRFKVKSINSAGQSSEGTSGNPAVTVK